MPINRKTRWQHKEGRLAKQKNKKYKLPPEEYRAILKGIELEGIMLEECSAKIRRDRLIGRAIVSVNHKISHEKEDENSVLVTCNYELIASTGSKRDFALKILCFFKAKYSSRSPLTDDFLEIFTERNAPMQIWPYFRELAQNMTQRMNIPPLTLPLLR